MGSKSHAEDIKKALELYITCVEFKDAGYELIVQLNDGQLVTRKKLEI